MDNSEASHNSTSRENPAPIWTLARLIQFLVVSFGVGLAAAGCQQVYKQTIDPSAAPLQNARRTMPIPTYDGSGQVTEPSIIVFDSPWHGFRYWMAFSPYPHGNDSHENPSIVASDDGITWQLPPGLVNPLALPGPSGYLADATIFHDSDADQLWVYYLEIKPAEKSLRIIKLVSPDGVQWQEQGPSLRVLPYNALSPTVEKNANGYSMWTVNSGPAGCSATSATVEVRTSMDGTEWSGPQRVSLEQPGYVVWHINVSYIVSKQEYWAAVAGYPDGSDCGHTVLFYLKSLDGVNWISYNRAVLKPSAGWDNAQIYRSHLLFDPNSNRLRVWYSARDRSGAWHIGLTEGDYDQFLESLQP